MIKDTSKETILIISVGFILLYLVFNWQWAIIVSFIVGVIGIMSSYLSRKIEWVWMNIAKLLEYIIPKIILSVVFFLFLYPIALISRLFTKDPLMLSKNYKSTFVKITSKRDKEDFEKIW